MTHVRVIYGAEPNFPATDNHPDAARYEVTHAGETKFADCVGGPPTQAEVDAFFVAAAGG